VPTHTRWFLVGILIGAGIVAAAQVGKAAIAVPLLQQDLGLSLAGAAWIVGAYALLGACAGLAIGWGVSRFGLRPSLLAGMVTMGWASIAGAFATNGSVLLVARVIEGCGLLGVAVSIPTLLRVVTAPADREVVLAAWSAYMPAGTGLMLVGGPLLLGLGWQGLWLANGVLLLLLVLPLALVVPAGTLPIGTAGNPAGLLRGPAPVLIALAFGLYTFEFTAISGLLPEFLVARHRLPIGTAGAIAGVAALANALGNLSAGALLRLGAPHWAIIVAAFACVGLASFGIFSPDLPVAAVAGLATLSLGIIGTIPASNFATAPRIVQDTGMLALMFGLINQVSNIGQLLGPAALGGVVQHFGWALAPLLLFGVAIAGIVVGLRLRMLLRPAGRRTSSASESQR
jgi:MFS family permease